MKVLLTGATGVAGLAMLRALLEDASISQVTILTRRPLPSWVVLPGGTSTPNASPTHPKLTTVTHKSFLTYSPELYPTLAAQDACLWALGRSSAGMTEAEYNEVTEGYLKAFLSAVHEVGLGSAEKPFRIVFVSGQGADPTEKSNILFARSKGRAENILSKFAHASSGSVKASIVRPGYFFPSPKYPADAQNQRAGGARFVNKVVPVLFAPMSARLMIPVTDLARFSVEAAKGKWEDKGELFSNSDMVKLLKGAA